MLVVPLPFYVTVRRAGREGEEGRGGEGRGGEGRGGEGEEGKGGGERREGRKERERDCHSEARAGQVDLKRYLGLALE